MSLRVPHIDVFVVNDGGEYFVRPATAIVRATQGVVWFENLSDSSVEIRFPGGFLAPDLTLGPRMEMAATVMAREPGLYLYDVVAAVRGEKKAVLGESSPKIIVDR
jgi:hypothetical protein